MTPSPSSSPVEGLLHLAAGESIVLEPYRPLYQSIDWQLGHEPYAQQGHGAFLDGDVPYLVTNDGLYAERAANVLFLSLEDRGAAPERIHVLEFGAGSCLFARLFDRAFERLCQQHGRDWSHRLEYIVADRFESMLDHAERFGVLPANGRVYTAVGDALSGELVPRESGRTVPQSFDLIVMNYVLDCLPAAIVRRLPDGGFEQLYLQTELAPEAGPVNGELTREDLIRLYPSMRVRCRYRRVATGELPYLEYVPQEPGATVIHNFGVLLCLERLLDRLNDGGFIWIGDYPSRASRTNVPGQSSIPYEHFGGFTAIALNFKLLGSFFEGKAGANWVEPNSEDHLIVRLLGSNLGARTRQWFVDEVSGDRVRALRAPQDLARTHAKNGRTQAALVAFLQAVRSQPNNWYLLSEAAKLVRTQLDKPAIAGRLAQLGLEMNPISLELWNALGDSLLALDRIDEAHGMYRKALEIAPSHPISKYNTIFTHTRKGEYADALKAIAEVMALDKTGEWTQQLLRRQAEIVEKIKQKHQGSEQKLMDRMVIEEI